MSEKSIQRAGEGGALPKGLSLFRFILFSSVLLGALYGGAGLYFDAPPMPGDFPPGGTPSALWQPSPVWLTAWVAIRAGIFVRRDPEGYRFTSQLGYAAFASSNIILGMLLLGCAGWIGGERVRRWWIVARAK